MFCNKICLLFFHLKLSLFVGAAVPTATVSAAAAGGTLTARAGDPTPAAATAAGAVGTAAHQASSILLVVNSCKTFIIYTQKVDRSWAVYKLFF
jgi:hypothetical protein